MNKHIRYVLRGLYEILWLFLAAGLAVGIIWGSISLMSAGYWIPVTIAITIVVSWFWGFTKESYDEYKH